MILKIRQARPVQGADDGWLWLDQIERVRAYGFLHDPAHDEATTSAFRSWEQLSGALNHTWGEQRSFETEVWPEKFRSSDRVADDVPGMYVSMFVARRRDGTDVLVILSDEGFLLSDDGKTVDRLR